MRTLIPKSTLELASVYMLGLQDTNSSKIAPQRGANVWSEELQNRAWDSHRRIGNEETPFSNEISLQRYGRESPNYRAHKWYAGDEIEIARLE